MPPATQGSASVPATVHSLPAPCHCPSTPPLPCTPPWPPAPSHAQVSLDGGLLQSSTVADRVSYCFAGGETQLVPGSYVEWAERRVLPEFASLPAEEVREWHRRDGFEASSADLIFESTTRAAVREGQQQ